MLTVGGRRFHLICGHRSGPELHSLLSGYRTLKRVSLHNIWFEDDSPTAPATSERVSASAVEDLDVWNLSADVVASILDTFTAVDITHLRSLTFFNTPFTRLLSANVSSLLCLQFSIFNTSLEGLPETSDLQILANATKLCGIVCNIYFPFTKASVVGLLSIPSMNQHLETIELVFIESDSFSCPVREWLDFDSHLSKHDEFPRLSRVQISLYLIDPTVQEMDFRQWLPSLSGRGILHVDYCI
ncbi:hypothetical protein B0H10DRAFT_718178 [Mycena sp. CBHHK59/15]|nr:hypothetical protein B0H10DRAFT_718178 [Mycena sp. CBHHK59/15]